MTPPLHDINVGEPPVLLQKSRGIGWLGLLAGLIIIAGLSGLLWTNYDHLIAASSSTFVPSTKVPETATAEVEPSPTLADFQALQQQTTQTWQSTNQLVEAQSAELKRLTDQVAALTARIEQQQQSVATPPSPRAEQPRPAAVAASPRLVPTAPRKQPAAAKRPAGTISVGGAPLPGTPPPPIR